MSATANAQLPWEGRRATPAFPWRILSKAGEGAMGEVYLAEDQDLGRRVAIKVIKPELLSSLSAADAQAAIQRFVQEARAAAALSHPGVPAVHRIGTEGGWPYIVMEWLDGQTLDGILAGRRRLPAEQAAWLGLQVLSVLETAHGAGIVHRDIKPENLLLTRDRRLKVTDFGIAHVRGSSLARTQVGALLGTPSYAAPEQLAGQPVDGRADLYSLGAVLYQALVGRPPFEATSLYELIQLVQTQPPLPPRTAVPGLPAALEAAILHALAKRPEDRFSTAREMAAVLQPFAASPGAAPRSAPATTLASVQTVWTSGATPQELVAGAVRQWPATPLGRRPTEPLLAQLAERPLHAPAFSGALDVGTATLLYYDGVLYAAFAPSTGRSGDEVVEGLAAEIDATLHAVPPGVEPRLPSLLASVLRPHEASWLDAGVTDLPRLAWKLADDGFDGALRIERGPLLGFALFSKGARVLDLFGEGWPAAAGRSRWERWITESGARARTEPRRASFPSLSFRQQLAECPLDVVRPAPPGEAAIRSDAAAEARAIRLESRGHSLHRSGSLLSSLVDEDPAQAAARWLLAELPLQFEQFGRTPRWRKLVEPLSEVREVRLHHAALGANTLPFAAATFGPNGDLSHLVDRAATGSPEAVRAFADRVLAVKQAGAPKLGGALLFAPRFSEEALGAYLELLRGAKARLFGALSHREGFVRLGVSDGVHLLLVEEGGEHRRPLVPE